MVTENLKEARDAWRDAFDAVGVAIAATRGLAASLWAALGFLAAEAVNEWDALVALVTGGAQ